MVVSIETIAYAKLILHAAKYPYCAVNGVLLADTPKKNQDLNIVDAVPLFHHSHYVSPMAEVALTQIETIAQKDNRVIAGYYAACENFKHNNIENCPGLKIAEKIAEYCPSAVFIVVDNKHLTQHLMSPAFEIHGYSNGKWQLKDSNKVIFQSQYVLDTVSNLLQEGVHRELVDFDNYLDDITQDWTNLGIEKLIASINASNNIDNER